MDSGKEEGCLDPSTPSFHTPSPQSPRSERYWAGRGDPAFPDVGMHLGMIFGMNSIDAPKHLDVVPNEMICMRLKFLEDKNTVTQTRNANLITENRNLLEQLKNEMTKNGELAEKLREKSRDEENRNDRTKGSMIIRKDRETTSADLVDKSERGVQAWSVCRACQRNLEGHANCDEPTVVITKSELENLESDMQALRDAVIAREEAWDRAMETEQNYRQQLARLSVEAVTARHLSETRRNELQTVTLALEEKDAELRATQKDMQSLKKIIVKLERRQRDLEKKFDLGSTTMGISDKEQKLVEEIVCRLPNAKGKQKPRPKGAGNWSRSTNSSGSSSQQTSPRGNRNFIGFGKELV